MQREVDKITAEKNEEVSRLKDHSEKVLTQIKKLKKGKKSLENKVQPLIEKETSNIEDQVEEKGINTDPVHVTAQEEDKPVEEKTHLDVIVQTMNIPSEGFVTNSTTSSLGVNHNIATHMIRQRQTKRTPYLHLNHKNRHLNQSVNLYHSKHEQQTYVSKTTNVSAIQCCANNSHKVSSNHKIPQKINLGWSDPFSI